MSDKMNKVRAGVIGVGRMGRYHVRVYSELFNTDLVGIVDLDSKKGNDIAERYNTLSYTDYKQLFNKVDIVSICVPTSLHYKIARDFLEAGINVLLEKPISDNMDNAKVLFRIAADKGLTLHIGHVERFNGAVQELKKIVKDPILIESRRMGPFDSRIQDDGVVMDLMIHDIDIILNLVNSEVDTINVMGSSVFSDKDDLANVQICFKDRCIANIVASRVTQNKIRTMAITQKDAYVFLDYTDQDIHIHRQASSEHRLTKEELRYKQESFIERIFVHRDNPLKLEILHFIDCSTNGTPRSIPIDKELMSLSVALEVVEKFKGNSRF